MTTRPLFDPVASDVLDRSLGNSSEVRRYFKNDASVGGWRRLRAAQVDTASAVMLVVWGRRPWGRHVADLFCSGSAGR
jgi:hypothetical protein